MAYAQREPAVFVAREDADVLHQALHGVFENPTAKASGHARMKPLIYGYMRVTDDLDDDDLHQRERGLDKLAEAEGFNLTETCYEHQPGYYGTFYELTQQLKRTQAHHVVMPSLDNLSAHPRLREQLLMPPEGIGVRVWTLKPYETDRELLLLLGSVGIRISEIVTGLFEDSLSSDEQRAFGNQLMQRAEGFRQRVRRTPLIVDAEAT